MRTSFGHDKYIYTKSTTIYFIACSSIRCKIKSISILGILGTVLGIANKCKYTKIHDIKQLPLIRISDNGT
jgi:hypothetical protein